MAARLITEFHLPTPQCFRSCQGPASCQSNDFLCDPDPGATSASPPHAPEENLQPGADSLRPGLIKYYHSQSPTNKMQRQASNGSPCKTKERGIFRRSVSKDSDSKVNVTSKGEHAKEKMVKNIYRRPISRAKGASLANRSVFGENRRQQFARCHFNQVWSSDPRDFRSHASTNRSNDSDSPDQSQSDPKKQGPLSRGRRSSSVPDVGFVAASGGQQSQNSSDEEEQEQTPQKQTDLQEEEEISPTKDKPKPGTSSKTPTKNTLEVMPVDYGGNCGRKPKSASPDYDGSRSPLLRHLYQKSRHLSHECEDRGQDKLSGSLDSSSVITKSFCRQLSLDSTTKSPKHPEECKAKPNVMLRSCDFELYDLDPAGRSSSSSSTASKRGLRVLVELDDVFLGNKTTVKALSGGRTLMIVANSSVNTSAIAGQGLKESMERIDLPVTVDPFSVKAKTPKSGHLCIEAPLRHQ